MLPLTTNLMRLKGYANAAVLLLSQDQSSKPFYSESHIAEAEIKKWKEDSAEQFQKTAEGVLSVLESRLEDLAAGKGQINELLAKMQP